MPRKISSVAVPVALAQEIDRLLSCAEKAPLIGGDAQRARAALRRAEPRAFPAAARPDGPPCEVCSQPIAFDRRMQAARVGTVAKYCSDRCRETARKRRYRVS
jgi:hypothetical protein